MLLEAIRAHEATTRVVVASSDKAYGAHEELPYREDFALQPTYPYDVSKAATDMIARSYAATYDMPVAVTRLANVYGPGDVNWARVIPDTARALVRGERPVIRSDGTPERDYIYVGGRRRRVPGGGGLARRPGEPRPRLERRLGRAAVRPRGGAPPDRDLSRDVEPDIQGTGVPHGEIDRQYLDPTAIRTELGWEPKWDLDSGLRAAWEWYERQLPTTEPLWRGAARPAHSMHSALSGTSLEPAGRRDRAAASVAAPVAALVELASARSASPRSPPGCCPRRCRCGG